MALPRHMRNKAHQSDDRRAAAREQAKATGVKTLEYVPARLLGPLRPNKDQARRWPHMGENTPHTGLLALVSGLVAARREFLWMYHTEFAVGSNVGYPDCTFVGRGGIMWRELKASDGRLSLVQLDRINRIREAGGDAAVWWPEDYHLGVIESELDALCVPRPGFVTAYPPFVVDLAAATGATPTPAAAGVAVLDRPRDPGKVYRFCGCEYGKDHEVECRRASERWAK